jgi:hypothetical protein
MIITITFPACIQASLALSVIEKPKARAFFEEPVVAFCYRVDDEANRAFAGTAWSDGRI